MFKLVPLIMFTMVVLASQGQEKKSTPGELIPALYRATADTDRLHLLLQISDAYLKRAPASKPVADSSLIYLKQATELADKIHIGRFRGETLMQWGRYYFAKEDQKRGRESFVKAANECETGGDKENAVNAWYELADHIPARDTLGLTRIFCYNKIRKLCQQLNNKLIDAWALKEIAILHLNSGKLDSAEIELFSVAKMFEVVDKKLVQSAYDLLAVTYRYKGDFQKALYYALKTIERMDATRDTAAATTYYSRLANIYRELNDPQNSVKWYGKVFRIRVNKGPNNLYMFRDAGFMARELFKLNRGNEALPFIRDIANKNKPIGKYAEASLQATLAFCYHALNQDDIAYKYYVRVIGLASDLDIDNEITADVNYEAGQFFFDRHQFAKAGLHFQKALDVSPGINSPAVIKDIELKLFSVDSAQGHYDLATVHLKKYQRIKDSLFNDTRIKQLQELHVKYETSEKEKDIRLLNNKNQLELIKVDQANRTKNITLSGIIILLIVFALLFNSYRIKQRANKKLEVQQIEIENQNISLRHLVGEKDWLIKEIHHRVKNNLQTVMSLLNSQSVYIDNESALTAIHDSQHRVHAMSLIHQKLYNSENVRSLDISVYTRELVSYLRDSFDTGQRIRFQLEIEPLEMDVSQAIPLGLIFNETITNSIKHAFPDGREGTISISLVHVTPNRLMLSIADNGIGMPAQFNKQITGSLGMSLIEGLSADLDGEVSIINDHGTVIKVVFVHDPVFKRVDKLDAGLASNHLS